MDRTTRSPAKKAAAFIATVLAIVGVFATATPPARAATTTEGTASASTGGDPLDTLDTTDQVMTNAWCLTLKLAGRCDIFLQATRDSLRISGEVYPDQDGGNTRRDALRHCLWQGLMTVNDGHKTYLAQLTGDVHETNMIWDGSVNYLHPDMPMPPLADHAMDYWNNFVARKEAAEPTMTADGIIQTCKTLAATAHQITTADLAEEYPRTGPVTDFEKKAEASGYLIYID
ncbi:DUF6973 domain-containing protein [Actinoallomurus iriomotensis]|uniref:DUF6973 domain-containing protein n=1 Tax=Actinoallomurus iriomotensis TaxID=478107 RepID=A0A9W6S6F8_9ACTN|nr:hypothetical protein [Actinoallomurus iriomotensis]GLY86577.1 hypothetical protein Airi02_045060 [Actinoallomurus iriomotensis]